MNKYCLVFLLVLVSKMSFGQIPDSTMLKNWQCLRIQLHEQSLEFQRLVFVHHESDSTVNYNYFLEELSRYQSDLFKTTVPTEKAIQLIEMRKGVIYGFALKALQSADSGSSKCGRKVKNLAQSNLMAAENLIFYYTNSYNAACESSKMPHLKFGA